MFPFVYITKYIITVLVDLTWDINILFKYSYVLWINIKLEDLKKYLIAGTLF